jgi:hypothetical protein
MSKANEDVELARAWLLGNSGLFDDLADLVESMIDKPLDPAARTFISTIGRDAKALAKGKARPASARLEAQTAPQTPAEPPPAPTIDINELWRRRRERNRAQRLDELARRNQEAFMDQAQMMRSMGWRD